MNVSNNNKRIAANTSYLYIRSIITIIITLFASRVILNNLGVEDFGLYNVIGGIVIMFSFLNNALTSAVQRFISFELGRNNLSKLNQVFCSAVNVHCILAVFVFIISETIGLYFVTNHLNIPVGREIAALCVYQAAVFSLIFTILQVPSLSCIIAHEDLNIYAIISVIDVILKLLAAISLYFINGDSLIAYAVMLFMISVGNALFYSIYSHKRYGECSYKPSFNKDIIKNIFSFSSWSLYGNLASIASTQGVNVILNIFCGTAVNAARGIAYQVNAAVGSLYSSFSQAINPQIVKQYSIGDIQYVSKLVIASSRFIFFLVYIFALPIIVETDIILQLWLGNVPEYAQIFCRLILISTLFESMSMPFVQAIQATGKIRNYQLLIGSVYIIDLPLSYLVLSYFSNPIYCFIVHIFVVAIVMTLRVYMYGKLLHVSINKFWHNIAYKILPVCGMSLITFLPSLFLAESFSRLCMSTLLCISVSCLLIILIGVEPEERKLIVEKIKSRNRHVG